MLTQEDVLYAKTNDVERVSTVSLVACGKAKSKSPQPAKWLYTSPLFRMSFRVGEAVARETYIISAKHGIVSPNEVVEPYDITLNSLDREQRANWRRQATGALNELAGRFEKIIVFGGASYLNEVRGILPNANIISALGSLSLGARVQHLTSLVRVLERELAASKLYGILEHHLGAGKFLPFEQFSKMPLPHKGVYIFVDPAERTRFSSVVPRIVRIGTHGVSEGSMSTLRTRLRAHFGLREGGGNHRASIFRLHVGAAIAGNLGIATQYPNWGVGQSAALEVRQPEIALEEQVSNYLRNLVVFVVEIDDISSAKSLRALVERTLISILAGEGGAIEQPSSAWLGNKSANAAVAKSGLWNVQHVGKPFVSREASIAFEILSRKGGTLI